MSISETILEIGSLWPEYYAWGTVNGTKRAYELVVDQFPNDLKTPLKNTTYLMFHGSTGSGNLTPAPWIATFDTRITRSATSGFYIVYLFSLDLKS